MDKVKSKQIKQCGAMMAIANRLYQCGLVTNSEYHKLMEEIRKRYHPAISQPQGNSPITKEK